VPSAKDGEMPAAVVPDATKIEVCPGEWKPCCYADNVSMPACKQRLSHVVWMCNKRATPNKLACCTVCCAWLIGSRAQWPDPDVLEKQSLGNKFFLACESCVLGRRRPCAGPSCVDDSYAAGVARSAEYARIFPRASIRTFGCSVQSRSSEELLRDRATSASVCLFSLQWRRRVIMLQIHPSVHACNVRM